MHKSPVGSRPPLEAVILEEGLTAYRCPETGGHFLPAESYWRWVMQQPERLPRLPPVEQEAPVEESGGEAKICPETGTIMTRYKIGHGFPFSIDRSINGGIWLDAGEWEALRDRQFHDELHLVFTSPWQRAVRLNESESSLRLRLRERLGAELADRLIALKEQLADHPSRPQALAFLMRED